MRTSKLHAVLAAVAVVGLGCPGPDNFTDPVNAWTAVLTGADHVPAITTTARGTASFQLNSAETQVTYTVNITTLPATAISSATLHQAAAGSSTNTVAVGLCGTGGTVPACTALTAPGVLITGTANVTAAQVTAMRGFGMYSNVRTAGNVNGEIRGQLRIVAP